MLRLFKVSSVFFMVFISLGLTQQRLQVCDSCQFSTLQEALVAAQEGDTIVVQAGLYAEGELLIDKSLTLLGEGWPILDGQNEFQIMTISANDVTVQGFIFQNSGVSHIADLAALKTLDVEGCVINHNRFVDNFFAIYLAKTRHCEVGHNEVSSNASSEIFSGNAVHLWDCYDVHIHNNTLSGHRDGIYLEFLRGAVIEDNLSNHNLRYGLHFMFSDDNVFRDNSFVNNGAGVAVMYSKKTTMVGNTFEDNWGSSSYGLLLKEINDSTVMNNSFAGNTVAIYVDGSNRTDIAQNDFAANGYALRLLSSSQGVRIMHNNFTGNTFDVTTNASRSYNAFLENHWSAYEGYDLDRDLVGDVSYRPISLFTLTVENYPQAVILLRSPLQQFMDYAERVLPLFTPKAIEDDRPLMRRLIW
nr:nitrous oxide reductase maturation protein [uncultured bacterium]